MLGTKIFTISQKTLLPTVLALALTSCEGTTLGHFDVDEPLPETRIEGSAIAAVLPVALPSMALDVTASEAFQRQDYDYLTSVQLDALTLSITEASSDETADTLEDGKVDDFDFLSSMEIFIMADFDGESHRVMIGSISEADPQLASARQAINFTMTGVDILQYVEAAAGYEVEIQAMGDAPPDAVIFNGDVRYRVGIGFR